MGKVKRDRGTSEACVEETEDTIFIRNLAFDTEETTLERFIRTNFGETIYCLICREKDTGDSKGTAFVKFKDKAAAAKCLMESSDKELRTKFHLEGRNLIVFPAISRERVRDLQKKGVKKDKRNLFLAEEGYIKPKSDEALQMSKSDFEARRTLEAKKRIKLKNLHYFISDTRLCIHNIPKPIDDAKLRHILLSSVKPNHPDAKILECKVMRNRTNSGKLTTSKGFAFVQFSKHEHALTALRSLNNNPKTFTPDKRPIVEFAVENMVAINKKKTRMARSKLKSKSQ